MAPDCRQRRSGPVQSNTAARFDPASPKLIVIVDQAAGVQRVLQRGRTDSGSREGEDSGTVVDDVHRRDGLLVPLNATETETQPKGALDGMMALIWLADTYTGIAFTDFDPRVTWMETPEKLLVSGKLVCEAPCCGPARSRISRTGSLGRSIPREVPGRSSCQH